MSTSKGQWGSSIGFLMAAVGSAVGLGNLWGFPYKMGMNGGFAFLILYLILAILVGFVIMTGELVIGRYTGKGVIAAYRIINNKFTFLGYMAFICPILILSFYCMLGGYCLRYAIGNIGTLFGASWGINGADPGEFFTAFFTNGVSTSVYSAIFVGLTVLIVVAGVKGGIESFTKIAMPALFVMLVIVIVRSVTLPGAAEGIAFMFKPNWEVFQGRGWISVLAAAGGQMFFSLSLGMGIMLTYGSYLSKKEKIEQSAFIIPIADTIIAIMAGLAVMPAVFAMGMEPNQGPGLLFVTLQGVFEAMGAMGPVFGFILYTLVFIAAITSSISLMEVAVSAIIDVSEKRGRSANRRKITVTMGIIVTLMAIWVSVDALGEGPLPHIGQFIWLDFFDLLSEGIMMPLGALIMSLLLGWGMGANWMRKEITLEGNQWRSEKFSMICLKVISPLGVLFVLLGQINNFFSLGWF